MKIKRPLIHLIVALTVVMLMTGFAFAEGEDKININTASVDELVQLDRVGPRYAEKIVAFRQENGPFKTPEDIMQVAGIGPKTFEVNKKSLNPFDTRTNIENSLQILNFIACSILNNNYGSKETHVHFTC